MSFSAELKAALRDAVAEDATLSTGLNGVYEERPPQARAPYLLLGDSIDSDWSARGFRGRELRLSLTLVHDARGDASLGALADALEAVVERLPPALPVGRIVLTQMLRRRTGRDGATGFLCLIDYRFLIEANG